MIRITFWIATLVAMAVALAPTTKAAAMYQSVENRIIGGTPVKPNELPYVVQLVLNNAHYCSGSLIGPSEILAAAHCALPYKDNHDNLLIRAGSIYSAEGKPDTKAQMRKVSKVIVHPQYNSSSRYDIAILKVSQPFKIGANVKPTALPSGNAPIPAAGTKLVTAGWGFTAENGNASSTLLKIDAPALDQKKCLEAYRGTSEPGYAWIFEGTVFCAGTFEGGKDTCNGDSGGALATTGTHPVVFGFTLFGNGCAKKGYPGFYQRVSSYRDWIKQNAGI